MGDDLLGHILQTTVTMSVPLIFAALGELLAERAGVVNIGLEGMLLAGAFAAMVTTHLSGSPWLGVLAAVAAAIGALSHPLLRDAGSAKRLHREWPVLLRREDGKLIEGTIDLAFSDGAHWTIVDFKTSSADQLRYRRQLQHYGVAIAKTTGLPVRGVLFEV